MKVSFIMVFLSAFMPCVAHDDQKGKEFAFSFIKPSKFDGRQTIIVTAEVRTDVTVNVPFNSYTATSTLEAGETWKIQLSSSFWVEIPFTVSQKTVRITSDYDVTVYVTDIALRTSSAFVALPFHALSMTYIAVTYGSQSTNSRGVDCYPTMLIISFRNETNVNVRYRIQNGGTCGGLATGESISFSLRAYEVYGIECTEDFTGTQIESNERVAVITGNGRAAIYPDQGKDIIQEMLLPVDYFGTEFVLFSHEARPMGTINRIVASMDHTEIVTSDGQTMFLNAFDFVDIDTDISGTMCVTASNPVEVVSFGKGFVTGNINGDDSMSIVPDVNKFTDDLFINFDLSGVILDTEYVHIVLIYDRNEYNPGAIRSGDYHQSVPGCKYDLHTRQILTWPFVLNAGIKVGAFLYGCHGSHNGLAFPINIKFDKGYDITSSTVNTLTSQLNPTAPIVNTEHIHLTSSYDNIVPHSESALSDYRVFTDMNMNSLHEKYDYETDTIYSSDDNYFLRSTIEPNTWFTNDLSQHTTGQVVQSFTMTISTSLLNQLTYFRSYSTSSSLVEVSSTTLKPLATTPMSPNASTQLATTPTQSSATTIMTSPSAPTESTTPSTSSLTTSFSLTSTQPTPSSLTTIMSSTKTTQLPTATTTTQSAPTESTKPSTLSLTTSFSLTSTPPSPSSPKSTSSPTSVSSSQVTLTPSLTTAVTTTLLSSLMFSSTTTFKPPTSPAILTKSPTTKQPKTSTTITSSENRSIGFLIPGFVANQERIRVCCFLKDIPEEVRSDIKQRIRKLLLLNKYMLSKAIRRRTSAKDERPSAQKLGHAGIVSLVFVAVVVIISDLTHKRSPNVIYIDVKRHKY